MERSILRLSTSLLKIFCETTIAKASIFGIQLCYVELYINPAKHALGVRNGPTPPGGWAIAPLDLQLKKKKHKKYLLLRNHIAQSFHILCGVSRKEVFGVQSWF